MVRAASSRPGRGARGGPGRNTRLANHFTRGCGEDPFPGSVGGKEGDMMNHPGTAVAGVDPHIEQAGAGCFLAVQQDTAVTCVDWEVFHGWTVDDPRLRRDDHRAGRGRRPGRPRGLDGTHRRRRGPLPGRPGVASGRCVELGLVPPTGRPGQRVTDHPIAATRSYERGPRPVAPTGRRPT